MHRKHPYFTNASLGCILKVGISVSALCLPAYAAEPRETKGIVFRLIQGSQAEGRYGRIAFFEFRNETSSAVKLEGYFGSGPRDGLFEPKGVDYIVKTGRKWKSLDIGYDSAPEDFVIPPQGRLRLQISLGPLERLKVEKTTALCVRVGDFFSEPFTLVDTLATKVSSQPQPTK